MTATDGSVIPAKRGRLVAIQYLRGVAAMLVVLHHALHARVGFFSPLGEGVDFGRPGVLIFFVISGFVMMHACGDEPAGQFARRRIIRVAPLYWVMTLMLFVLIARNDISSGDPMRRVPALLQSLVFVPHYHTGMPDEIWPILVPGWTLNYEMFFFLVFAIGIALGRPAVVSVAILAALVLLGLVFPGKSALWRTWTNTFLVLFIAGMALALWWQRRDFSAVVWMLPAGLALVCFAALGGLPEHWTHSAFYFAAVATVAGALGLQDRNPAFGNRILATIGDASYSIYLSHTILMIGLYAALRKLPLAGWPQFIAVLVVVLGACASVGILIHRWVEVPMTASLRKRFDR